MAHPCPMAHALYILYVELAAMGAVTLFVDAAVASHPNWFVYQSYIRLDHCAGNS